MQTACYTQLILIKTTSFPGASFGDYVLVRSGVEFKKPQSIAVEPSKYVRDLAVGLYVGNTPWGEVIARGEFTGGWITLKLNLLIMAAEKSL